VPVGQNMKSPAISPEMELVVLGHGSKFELELNDWCISTGAASYSDWANIAPRR